MKRTISLSPNHPALQLARAFLNGDPKAEPKIMEMLSGRADLIMKFNTILLEKLKIPLPVPGACGSTPAMIARGKEKRNIIDKTATVGDGNEAKAKHKINNTILPEKRKRPVNDEQNDQVLTENTNTNRNTSSQCQPLPLACASGSRSNAAVGDLEKALIFSNKVRDYLCNEDDHLQFLRILYYYSIEAIEKTDMRKMISDELLGKNPKLMNEFDELIDHYSNQSQSAPEEKKKDPKQKLPTREEETSNPSYKYLLPAEARKRGKRESESEVLNTEWVLTRNVTSKPKERNEHEEIMNDWEDNLYKYDMVRENLKSTLEKMKRLITDICDKKVELRPPRRAEDFLNLRNLTCIEQLYGEYGADILDLLATEPYKTLPVIVLRLDQKVEEFETRHRSRIDKLWREANGHAVLNDSCV